MTKIFAFSGAGNTGKTTIINRLSEYFSKQGYKVKIYDEIPRSLFYIIEKDGMEKFQMMINKKELERLDEIKNDILKSDFDLILIDRTTVDNWTYYVFNKMKNGWKDNVDFSYFFENIYNIVFFFGNEIKQTFNPNFTQYNNETEKINDHMKKNVGESFNTMFLSNGKDDYDEVIFEIEKQLV